MTTTYADPRRDKSALDEVTQDPVFLAQARYWLYCSECLDSLAVDHCEDCTGLWRTERVFMWRKEAEEWMEARKHRWPDGHRVYCVPSGGSLAVALREMAP